MIITRRIISISFIYQAHPHTFKQIAPLLQTLALAVYEPAKLAKTRTAIRGCCCKEYFRVYFFLACCKFKNIYVQKALRNKLIFLHNN